MVLFCVMLLYGVVFFAILCHCVIGYGVLLYFCTVVLLTLYCIILFHAVLLLCGIVLLCYCVLFFAMWCGCCNIVLSSSLSCIIISCCVVIV